MNQKKKELITQLQLLCYQLQLLNGDLVFVEDGNDVPQY